MPKPCNPSEEEINALKSCLNKSPTDTCQQQFIKLGADCEKCVGSEMGKLIKKGENDNKAILKLQNMENGNIRPDNPIMDCFSSNRHIVNRFLPLIYTAAQRTTSAVSPSPSPYPSPSPSPSPSLPPSPSPGIYEQSYMEIFVQQGIFLCISVIIFHYALDSKCAENAIGAFANMSKQFSDNTLVTVVLFALIVLGNVSNILRTYTHMKTDEQKSIVLKKGGLSALLSMVTSGIIIMILLSKCRSPFWIMLPLMIVSILVVLLITVMFAGAASFA
jgi:hypothetical protein